MRLASLALAGLLLAGQLAALAHQAAVTHRTCEHGEIVHEGKQAPAPDSADETWKQASAEATHEHGCAFYLCHAPITSSLIATVTVATCSEHIAPRLAQAPTQSAVRIARSRSPPA